MRTNKGFDFPLHSLLNIYTHIKHIIELFRSLLNMTMTSADLELNWEHSKPLAKRKFFQIFPHLLYLYPRLSHRFSFASPRLDKQYRHRYLLDFEHEGILGYRGYWNSFFQIKMTGHFEQNPSLNWPCYQKELDIGLVSFVYIYTVTDFRITESVWINRLDGKQQWEKMTHYPLCVVWFPGPSDQKRSAVKIPHIFSWVARAVGREVCEVNGLYSTEPQMGSCFFNLVARDRCYNLLCLNLR